MIDLFAQEQSDDLPEFAEILYEQVERYWQEWLIYRAVGRRNQAGSFEPNITYKEAINDIADEKIRVFFALDDLYGRMERQFIKQKGLGHNG